MVSIPLYIETSAHMKRQLEQTEEGIAFFHLPEAIEILLSAVPFAAFLAQLIQLCKRTRRQAWDFLSDPIKCTSTWISSLCRDLGHYRERRNKGSFGVRVMYPVFVQTRTSYALCRVIGPKEVLWATQCHFTQGTRDREEGYPGWEIVLRQDLNKSFIWYFVARALLLGWDIRIANYGRRCWQGEIIAPDDVNLCLL